MPNAVFTLNTTSRLRRTTGHRALSFVLVAALALAPLLANVWPAFGKGAMLYVGNAVAPSLPQADHAEHAGHAGHEGHEGNEAPATAPHHQQHCALCVLALLGWAPPADLSVHSAETGVTDRTVSIAAPAPRLRLAWRSAHARAPSRS